MILYKKDSKGKLRVLEIFAEGDQVVQRSGLFDGKRSETRSSCIGKNIGRSNETSPEEQALLEAEAKIRKKLEKEYFTTKEEAEGSEVLLPMLAKDYKKESHKISWKQTVVQPKLDGMRCLAVIGDNGSIQLLSREGKDIQEQYNSMYHIIADLSNMGLKKGLILDGELYSHGLTFQENMKLIKKDRGEETHQIKYHIYDVVNTKENFPLRHLNLRAKVGMHCDKDYSYLSFVRTIDVNNEAEVKKWHIQFLSEGYEGSIIRHGDDGYKVKGRSSSLLKYKDFIDEAFEIIDVVPSEKSPEQGIFECKTKEEQVFRCGMKFSHEEREDILLNKTDYIGKMAEIRFFEWTDGGLPRFPQAVGVRLDK